MSHDNHMVDVCKVSIPNYHVSESNPNLKDTHNIVLLFRKLPEFQHELVTKRQCM